jgi:hypothetical protein
MTDYKPPRQSAGPQTARRVSRNYVQSNARPFTRSPRRGEVADAAHDALVEQFATAQPDWEVTDVRNVAGTSLLSIRDCVTGAEFEIALTTKYAGDAVPVTIPED